MTRTDWFRGPLLSRHFAEQVLPQAFASRLGESSADGAQRRLRRWLTVAQTVLGPASGIRAMCDVGAVPLFTTLGYRVCSIAATGDPAQLVAIVEGGRGVALPLVVTAWGARLDQAWRVALRAGTNGREPRSREPSASTESSRERWAFCFNGRSLRLLDLDRPYARRFIEFDLAETIPDTARCRLLWAIARPAAFGRTFADGKVADPDADVARRSMRTAGRASLSHPRAPRHRPLLSDIVDACDAHGLSVREALQGGVREALELLCAELARAARRTRVGAAHGTHITAVDVVSQGLTLLYRVLFLLFAEARALVPVWHPLYRDSYTIATLHRQAERAAPRGLWDALQAISRLAHEGCETDELSMTAFNSQLFSPDCAPLVDRARIDSATIGRVLRALMTTPGRPGRGRERITYADLGVEQLGAVYERILDYAPELEAGTASRLARRARTVRPPPPLQPSAGPRHARTRVRRKETGTFYTPRSLADALVRDTLGPLTASATADRILELRVLDPAMGSGAFLVSACRFLTYAYEQALAREDRELPSTDAARAEVRRTIARQCLFGVDLNPMAVQLARLSLWLTTLTTDAPLTFLDHHLRVGDSLVGASLDDLARRLPARSSSRRGRTGRDAETLPLFSQEETSGLMRAILPSRARFTEADDRPETVHAKEQLLAALTRDSALSTWLTLADLWCASWFWLSSSTSGTAPPPTAWAALCDLVLRGQSILPAHTAAAWLAHAREVAARQRFFHWSLEFPEVFFDASGEPRADGGFDAIVGNPPWDMVRDDGEAPRERPAAALTRFARETGIYEMPGDAHTNSYQLFVDRSLSLLRRDGGRLGLVVPWGLAADHGSARLRRRLLERCDVDTMISFDNRDGLFPIHRSLRFLLFTCTTGRPTTHIACRFGERDPAMLDAMPRGSEPSLSMAPALLRRVSGEGCAFPDVRSREGLALLERLHASWPPLTSAEGWHVTFGRELHASDDRAWLDASTSAASTATTSAATTPADPWPVIEGKHLHPFDVRPDDARFVVPRRHMTAVRTRVPGIARHRLAYRDISSATNRTTLIAAIVPPFVVTTHTLFCLRSPLDLDAQHCLCALMNSYVANYLVRLRISTHVTLALLHQLPVPVPAPETCRQLAAFASEASKTPRSRARLQLQAVAAQAYGLTAGELRHVLSTFPLVEQAEKEAVFDAFLSLMG